MPTQFSLSPTDLNLADISRAERGSMYLAFHDGELKLGVGFAARNAIDRDDSPSGVLFLTGSTPLTAHFFVSTSGFLSDAPPLLACKTNQTWADVRIELEQRQADRGKTKPSLGVIGIFEHYSTLHVLVREEDITRRQHAMAVDLSDMKLRHSDNLYVAEFELRGVIHESLRQED